VKKTKIFLHIGHGKTGTSAIQSSLAMASEDLSKRGINYPIPQSLRDRASRLEITSGNWEPIPEVNLTDQLIEIAKKNQEDSKIILSSESLFWLIPELIQNKRNWETHIDLHIILAVREIEEMLSSEYQQRVKRHGDAMPMEQFLRARHFVSSHHAKAAEIIELMTQSSITNTIINYSRHKRNISKLIFKFIGAEDLYPAEEMAGAIINRSLSSKELEILITINALYYSKFPWISAKISDTLINNQPNLEPQQCKIGQQYLQKVYEINNAYLQAINASLNETEQLTSLSNRKQEEAQVKSIEQIQKSSDEEKISVDLIAETLLQALSIGKKSKQQLSKDTVDAIIKLSQSGTVTKTTAVELLEVAKENRPQGKKLAMLLERARKELVKL
jgi:hypothetical protein